MRQTPPSPLENKLGIPGRDVERFVRKINRDGHCWIWEGGKNEYGYGIFWLEPKTPLRAHRLCYELAVGPIPRGYHLHHLVREKQCIGPSCVNPDHLEPVTPKDHALNKSVGSVGYIESRQTHCKRGHEFTPETIQVRKNGKKQCKICANDLKHAKYVAHPKTDNTHCCNGHPFSGTNLVMYKTSRGVLGRGCRKCRAEAASRYRKRSHEISCPRP